MSYTLFFFTQPPDLCLSIRKALESLGIQRTEFWEHKQNGYKTKWQGFAQLPARLLWECGGHHPRPEKRKPGKPCNTGVCGILAGCENRPKNGFDHRIDHRQENL